MSALRAYQHVFLRIQKSLLVENEKFVFSEYSKELSVYFRKCSNKDTLKKFQKLALSFDVL